VGPVLRPGAAMGGVRWQCTWRICPFLLLFQTLGHKRLLWSVEPRGRERGGGGGGCAGGAVGGLQGRGQERVGWSWS